MLWVRVCFNVYGFVGRSSRYLWVSHVVRCELLGRGLKCWDERGVVKLLVLVLEPLNAWDLSIHVLVNVWRCAMEGGGNVKGRRIVVCIYAWVTFGSSEIYIWEVNGFST